MTYKSILELIRSFRTSGGNHAVTPDPYDSPAHMYFRVFFDFQDSALLDINAPLPMKNLSTNNRVGPKTKEDNKEKKESENEWYTKPIGKNTALKYLLMNGEWQRADMLVKFVQLLSNISTLSPWYFQSIEGLGEALKREAYESETFTLPDRKPISIKCLPDAYDTRIGTLLDLYRTIYMSQNLHRIILPENLRRFNMYVYIFNTPLYGVHTPNKKPRGFKAGVDGQGTGWASIDHDSNRVTNSKLIEFRDCVFSIDSSASGFETLDNTEGFSPQYTIGILPRTIREQRYNELLNRIIGDMVMTDIFEDEDKTGGQKNSGFPNGSMPQKEDLDNLIKDSYDVNRENDGVDNVHLDGVELGDRQGGDRESRLGEKIHVDVNKPSNMDPFTRLLDKKVSQGLTYGNSLVQTGLSTLESWTPGGLMQSGANALDRVLNRVTFGNLFHNTMDTTIEKVMGAISSLSSGNVANQITSGGTRNSRGWTHTSSLGSNIGDHTGTVGADTTIRHSSIGSNMSDQ